MGVPDSRKSPREPHKNQFVELKLRLHYFYIKRCLRDKMFDIVLSTPLRNLPTGPHKINSIERLELGR